MTEPVTSQISLPYADANTDSDRRFYSLDRAMTVRLAKVIGISQIIFGGILGFFMCAGISSSRNSNAAGPLQHDAVAAIVIPWTLSQKTSPHTRPRPVQIKLIKIDSAILLSGVFAGDVIEVRALQRHLLMKKNSDSPVEIGGRSYTFGYLNRFLNELNQSSGGRLTQSQADVLMELCRPERNPYMSREDQMRSPFARCEFSDDGMLDVVRASKVYANRGYRPFINQRDRELSPNELWIDPLGNLTAQSPKVIAADAADASFARAQADARQRDLQRQASIDARHLHVNRATSLPCLLAGLIGAGVGVHTVLKCASRPLDRLPAPTTLYIVSTICSVAAFAWLLNGLWRGEPAFNSRFGPASIIFLPALFAGLFILDVLVTFRLSMPPQMDSAAPLMVLPSTTD